MEKKEFEGMVRETGEWETITEFQYNACFLGAWGKYCKARLKTTI